MTESTSLDLSSAFKNKPTIDKKQLYQELIKQEAKISQLLSGYHFMERGRVHDVKINEDSLLTDEKGNGKFTVNYKIGIFNACADIDTATEAKMEIALQIDQETGKAVLKGEEIRERDPDEF